MALPDTTHRVAKHTSEKIPGWLRVLDREWDIERALETNASTLTVVTCILGFAVNSIFLLSHSL